MKHPITISKLSVSFVSSLVDAFAKANWLKPVSLFEIYLKEQHNDQRLIWVAHMNHEYMGYVTLKWHSHYSPFIKSGIPEIMDLNVLPYYRNSGVGSSLLQIAERQAFEKSSVVGIGVGLYGGCDGGYGPAQRLYIKRGYIPDGYGITYDYLPIIPGKTYPIDDNLVLWLTKNKDEIIKKHL